MSNIPTKDGGRDTWPKLANVKAEALVDALADTLADVEAKTLSNTLAEVKAKELVDNLAYSPTEVES